MKFSSVSVTAPTGTLTGLSSAPLLTRVNSVLPPPVSKISTSPRAAPSMLFSIARPERAASSSPEMTRTSGPPASRTIFKKSAAFFAVRSAIVPTQTVSSAPCERAKSANLTTACAVRAIASRESVPLSCIPSPSLVITLTSNNIFIPCSRERSPTVSFTEFVPISMTAFFICLPLSALIKRRYFFAAVPVLSR